MPHFIILYKWEYAAKKLKSIQRSHILNESSVVLVQSMALVLQNFQVKLIIILHGDIKRPAAIRRTNYLKLDHKNVLCAM